MASNNISSWFISWCAVRYDFRVKTFLPSCCVLEVHVLFVICTGVQRDFHVISCSICLTLTVVVANSGTGTDIPSGAPEFTPSFNGGRVPQSLAFCVVFCWSLFVLFPFVIVLSIPPPFMASNYPFGIKQWWSIIPPVSKIKTTNSHLKHLNAKKKITKYGVGNSGPCFEQKQKPGGVYLVNEIASLILW